MPKFVDLIWSEKSMLIHVIILVSLMSVSLWDTVLILDDYINDNRLTLVKIKSVQDTFPFLENTSLQACFNFYFQGSSIFPEYWQKNLTEEEHNVAMFDDQTQSLKDNFHAANFFAQIGDMDVVAIECALIGFNKSCSDTVSEVFSPLQPFLQNGSFLVELQDSLWKQVHPSLIWRRIYYLPDVNTVDFTPATMTESNICIDLHLPRFLRLKAPVFEYLICPIGSREFVTNATVEPTVGLFAPNFMSPTFILGRKGRTDVLLNIANFGMYDISATTTCTTIPHPPRIKKFEDLRPESHCMPHVYFQAMVTYCGCIPFSFRRQFGIYRTDSSQTLSYCTPEKYKRCIFDVMVALERSPPCLPQCLTANNQISMTITSSSTEVFEVDDDYKVLPPIFSRARIVFQCKVTSYAISEQRYQLSITQLIAQVGGDIGLYTGFSMLGIWHFMIQVFYCCKRKKKREANEVRRVSTSIIGTKNERFWAWSNNEDETMEMRLAELERIVKVLKEDLSGPVSCETSRF